MYLKAIALLCVLFVIGILFFAFQSLCTGSDDIAADETDKPVQFVWKNGYAWLNCDNFRYCGNHLLSNNGVWGYTDPQILCCSPECAEKVLARYERGYEPYSTAKG